MNKQNLNFVNEVVKKNLLYFQQYDIQTAVGDINAKTPIELKHYNIYNKKKKVFSDLTTYDLT